MNKGFALVEILVALSVFGMFVSLFLTFYETNRNSYENVLQNDKAVLLAKEGVEAVRYIRDVDWDDLASGTHGISSASGLWELDGSSDQVEDFTREVIISEIDDDTKKIESKISFNIFDDAKEVSLLTYLTNWTADFPSSFCINQADYLLVDISNANLTSKDKKLENIIVSNIENTCEIEIASFEVAWTPNKKDERIKEIIFDGVTIWSGNLKSGNVEDSTDVVLPISANNLPISFKFGKKMKSKTIDIIFTMSDGTTALVTYND